jgi:hypothetical protein
MDADRSYKRWDSSYALNAFVAGLGNVNEFMIESDIREPSDMPLLGDGAGSVGFAIATVPAKDLWNGPVPLVFAIPRHGSRPRVIPTDHPPDQKLPGAINMAFYDGRVDQVQLERLWSLYWHKDYVAPEKRPGLK